MGYIPPPPNWRNEPGMVCSSKYVKKFAYLPIKCGTDNIWFTHYYKYYQIWTAGLPSTFEEQYYHHTDFIENITEADYIVRKLAETL